MSIYYSEITGGIYDTSFASYSLPDDAVLITNERRDDLIISSMAISQQENAPFDVVLKSKIQAF